MVRFNKCPQYLYFNKKNGLVVKLAITLPLQGGISGSYPDGSTVYMANNNFAKEVSKDCPHCGKHFNCLHSEYANHVRWCKENPNRKELDHSTKEKIKKSFSKKKKEFEVFCSKCGKTFSVTEQIDKFPKKEKYYCSRSCANSRVKTEEVKLKTQTSLNKYYHSDRFKYKRYNHICKNCGTSFENSKKDSKYCSDSCRLEHIKKSKTRSDFEQYRSKCAFNFSLNDYPDEFDFDMLKAYGMYKAKNHGNNLSGVSRDHMVSVKYGYENNIDPKIISHPANCKLMLHSENVKKYDSCSITIDELLTRIEFWDKKYKNNYPQKECNAVCTTL